MVKPYIKTVITRLLAVTRSMYPITDKILNDGMCSQTQIWRRDLFVTLLAACLGLDTHDTLLKQYPDYLPVNIDMLDTHDTFGDHGFNNPWIVYIHKSFMDGKHDL